MSRRGAQAVWAASAAAVLFLPTGPGHAAGHHHRRHHPPTSRRAHRPPAPQGVTVYVVRRGDTLARIAKRLGTSLEEVRAANRPHGDRLAVGNQLRVRTEG